MYIQYLITDCTQSISVHNSIQYSLSIANVQWSQRNCAHVRNRNKYEILFFKHTHRHSLKLPPETALHDAPIDKWNFNDNGLKEALSRSNEYAFHQNVCIIYNIIFTIVMLLAQTYICSGRSFLEKIQKHHSQSILHVYINVCVGFVMPCPQRKTIQFERQGQSQVKS